MPARICRTWICAAGKLCHFVRCGQLTGAASGVRAVWCCSTPLDVMRVDTGDGSHRMSVCYATYGYMGDLLYVSEAMR